jgi:hypothetical protein
MMPFLVVRVSAGTRRNIAQFCQAPSVIAGQNNTFVPAERARENVERWPYTMGGAAPDRDDGKMLAMRFTSAFSAPSSPGRRKNPGNS